MAAAKIYAQALSDQFMAQHPELLSVTFHGTPPGDPGVYTMFAGSYPERIGNPDDPAAGPDFELCRPVCTRILNANFRFGCPARPCRAREPSRHARAGSSCVS